MLKEKQAMPLLGLCSGVLAGIPLFIDVGYTTTVDLYIGSGLFFGLLVACYNFFGKKIKIAKMLLFIILSTISYFVPVFFIMQEKGYRYPLDPFLIAGLIGAMMLSFSYHFFINKLSAFKFLLTVLAGGVLAWIWVDLLIGSLVELPLSLTILFILWNTIMAWLLAWSSKHQNILK